MKEVRGHYNQHRDLSLQGRHLSRLIFLRKFNNWVKLTEILRYGAQAKQNGQLRVLDLCCGKGADLYKWERAGATHYVGVDLAINRLREARDKVYDPRKLHFGGFLKEADVGSVQLTRDFPASIKSREFDIVSCQFSMHYLLQSEATIRRFLENVSGQLREGGVFIGTTPDATVLASKLYRAFPKPPRAGGGGGGEEQQSQLIFGNLFYSIKFEEWGIPKSKPFGREYGFYLEDSVGEKIGSKITKYVPEYLVIFQALEPVAKDYGLELVSKQNFHKLYLRKMEEYEELKRSSYEQDTWDRAVRDLSGDHVPEQWDISYLYLAFAFRKTKPWKPEVSFNPFLAGPFEDERQQEDEGGPEQQQIEDGPGGRRGKRQLILIDDQF